MKNSTKTKGSANGVNRRSSVAVTTRFSIHGDDLVAGTSSSPSFVPIPKKRRTVSSEPFEEIEPEVEEEEKEAEEEEAEEDDEDEDEEMVPENEDVTGTTDPVSEDPSGRGSISVTLTDPDVLDCPICFNSLSIPVFQCENGHIACATCCISTSHRCPMCSMPIGYNRCRALERILDSAKVPCPNNRYGCKESLICSKINEHEPICIYTPCSCPLRTCNFRGFSKGVYTHFQSRHTSSVKRIIFNSSKSISLKKNQRCLFLQERSEGIIFVVNHHNDHLGSAVNIICIAPGSSNRKFPYKIKARGGGEQTCGKGGGGGGEISIKLESVAENITKWDSSTPLKRFLLVPSDITDSCDQFKLEVCIKNQECTIL